MAQTDGSAIPVTERLTITEIPALPRIHLQSGNMILNQLRTLPKGVVMKTYPQVTEVWAEVAVIQEATTETSGVEAT